MNKSYLGAALGFIAVWLLSNKAKSSTNAPNAEGGNDMNTNKTDTTANRNGKSLAVFNKNFGNIRNAGKRYSFEITPQGNGYKKFETWADGCAGMLVHLYRYMNGKLFSAPDTKRDTIEKILYTWAPPFENETEDYINFVAKESQIPRNAMIVFAPGTLYLICKAMAKREDGTAAKNFNAEVFSAAWLIASEEIFKVYKTKVPLFANI